MEFQKQRWALGHRGLLVRVDRPNGPLAKKFTPGNRYTHLNRLNHGIDRRRHIRKTDHGGADRLRLGIEPHRRFNDHTQCPLGAHKQAGQVVPS